MSLSKTSVVDLVVKHPAGGRAELIVFDDGSVTDPVQRLRLLQSKLRTYATFVSSGQYRSKLQGVEPSQLSVSVVCVSPPTAAMQRLERLRLSLVPPLTLPIRVETVGASRERLSSAQPSAAPAGSLETDAPQPGASPIPRTAIVLAGFTLAHAAVCVSDVAETLRRLRSYRTVGSDASNASRRLGSRSRSTSARRPWRTSTPTPGRSRTKGSCLPQR